MKTEPQAPKLKQKSHAFKPFLAPEAAAEKAAAEAAAEHVLRALLRGRGFALRLFCLRVILRYERLRLGKDAQSLYLMRAAAEGGFKPPRLSIERCLSLLLALSAK